MMKKSILPMALTVVIEGIILLGYLFIMKGNNPFVYYMVVSFFGFFQHYYYVTALKVYQNKQRALILGNLLLLATFLFSVYAYFRSTP